MPSSETLTSMVRVLRHRGPDDEGTYRSKGVSLGMRRLSIIDLEGGHQPIRDETGRYWIVYNGETYNFPELREELEKKGHRFQTHTDTEAVLHAYEEWGETCVERLNGMFAFAVWDERERRLFLARDRIGIKPLFWSEYKGGIAFGSEMKCLFEIPDLLREIDLAALDRFLHFEYVPAPQTCILSIRKLPPGHTLTWDRKGVRVERYWDVRFDGSDAPRRMEEARERLEELIADAVRMRLVSDVPLGAFLSGGIDSSTIVAMMHQAGAQPLKTFSIGFEEASYNELKWARIVAERFGTEHHEFTVRYDAVNLIHTLLEFLDEPFGDFSVFPTYLVSKMARQHVKVVLSGDGGDEVFAGYDTYLAHGLSQRHGFLFGGLPRSLNPLLKRLPPSSKKKGLVNRIKRYAWGLKFPSDVKHVRWMSFLDEEMEENLYGDTLRKILERGDTYKPFRKLFLHAADWPELSQQQYVDIHTYLVDDILVKVDRMSMAVSLEARVPLLDHRIVEFAASLPPAFKLKGLTTKRIFRETVAPLLPKEILTKPKEGFSIPIKNWLREELRGMLLDTLSEKRIREGGLFRPEGVNALVREHLEGRENHSHLLWALMVFELWREKLSL